MNRIVSDVLTYVSFRGKVVSLYPVMHGQVGGNFRIQTIALYSNSSYLFHNIITQATYMFAIIFICMYMYMYRNGRDFCIVITYYFTMVQCIFTSHFPSPHTICAYIYYRSIRSCIAHRWNLYSGVKPKTLVWESTALENTVCINIAWIKTTLLDHGLFARNKHYSPTKIIWTEISVIVRLQQVLNDENFPAFITTHRIGPWVSVTRLP